MESLELLKVNLEIFLAPHPILMILSHLERVFNRWQWLDWKLVNQMALLEVFSKVEAENRSRITRIIACCIIKMSSDEMIDLIGLPVDKALSEVERCEVFISGRANFVIKDLLTI